VRPELHDGHPAGRRLRRLLARVLEACRREMPSGAGHLLPDKGVDPGRLHDRPGHGGRAGADLDILLIPPRRGQ